jgi:hypothetical protein
MISAPREAIRLRRFGRRAGIEYLSCHKPLNGPSRRVANEVAARLTPLVDGGMP